MWLEYTTGVLKQTSLDRAQWVSRGRYLDMEARARLWKDLKTDLQSLNFYPLGKGELLAYLV